MNWVQEYFAYPIAITNNYELEFNSNSGIKNILYVLENLNTIENIEEIAYNMVHHNHDKYTQQTRTLPEKFGGLLESVSAKLFKKQGSRRVYYSDYYGLSFPDYYSDEMCKSSFEQVTTIFCLELLQEFVLELA